MPKTDLKHIEAIAAKCQVRRMLYRAIHEVRYRDFLAHYDLSGDRPKFVTESVGHGYKIATAQVVIDGMREAAQRVIDKRKGDQVVKTFAELMDGMLSTPSIGETAFGKIFGKPPFAAVDPAKPGSDQTAIWYMPWPPRFPTQRLHFATGLGKSLAPDPISLKISAMAIMSFEQLAAEYKAAKDRRQQIEGRPLDGSIPKDRDLISEHSRMAKIMDLADDIACARYGVGFYSPGQ